MELIFVGLLFIFLKTNIYFAEIGIIYYLTNTLGYMSIYAGINKLEGKYDKLNKLKPLAIVMIIHSIVFFLLNLTDYSPLTMSLSGNVNVVIAVLGLGFIIVGMFVVYYIIHTIVQNFKCGENDILGIKRLDQLNNAMTIVFIFAGISFFISFIAIIMEVLMISLLLLQVVFLFYFYNTLVKRSLN